MNILTFLIVGLLAGWIASAIVKGQGSGMLLDIFIGVLGAFVGGFIFSMFGITAYGFYGALGMSIVGSITFLWITGLLSKKTISVKH